MSLFDFGTFAAPGSTGSLPSRASSSRGSTSSLDELDISGTSTPTVSTERFERQVRHMQRHGAATIAEPVSDEEDWHIISKKIDSCVRLDTQFFEYPSTELFSSPPTSGNIDDDELVGTKVFLGGMRFEVVQLGRHMVSWLLEMSCGVRLPFGRILIHRKSRNGKAAAPTGCASVYVENDEDVKKLIAMNQRIFCGERGLHVAPTPERMAELIQSRTILDIVDGRVRGPTHPMIIEKAYTTASHSPVSIAMTPQNGSFASASSSITSLTGATHSARATPHGNREPIVMPDGSSPPVYHKYEGDSKTIINADPQLHQPLELFVGGLCYEATRTFVAWLFSLIQIKLHPQNVTLYVDPQTGVKRGCAQVRIEESQFALASSFTRRLLCDACGVYIAETSQGILAVQQTKERSEHGARGPTHAVVIERRRNAQRPSVAASTTVAPTSTPQAGSPAQGHPAPPPPPAVSTPVSGGPSMQMQMQGMPGLMMDPACMLQQGQSQPQTQPPQAQPGQPQMQLLQMPGGQYVMVVNAQPGTTFMTQGPPQMMMQPVPAWPNAPPQYSPMQALPPGATFMQPMAMPPMMPGQPGQMMPPMAAPPGGSQLYQSFRVQGAGR